MPFPWSLYLLWLSLCNRLLCFRVLNDLLSSRNIPRVCYWLSRSYEKKTLEVVQTILSLNPHMKMNNLLSFAGKLFRLFIRVNSVIIIINIFIFIFLLRGSNGCFWEISTTSYNGDGNIYTRTWLVSSLVAIIEYNYIDISWSCIKWRQQVNKIFHWLLSK